jgi:hypothetical protein
MNFYTFYTQLLWLLAYIYSSLQPVLTGFSKVTKSTYNSIYNYFTDNKKDESKDTSLIYVTDGEKMVPFSFDISKLHKHLLLFYVVIKIDDNHTKVIVFNSLDKLLILYNNLHDLVKSRMSKFSKYLEVRITNNTTVDHLDTFSQYTDKLDTYFGELTGYNVRTRDIYDFKSDCFLLSHGDKLLVTKMDLSSHEYHFEDTLRS